MQKVFYIFIFLFCSLTVPAQLVNAGFENWTSTTTDVIDTWTPQGKVSKSTSGQQGTYAAKLETTLQGFNLAPGILALTGPTFSGFPYSDKIDTVKVWVQYSIANADTAIFHIEQLNADTNLVRAGSQFILTGSTTAWTELSIPMDVNDTTFNPETILVYISNTLDYNPQPSSYLTVDNIRCYYKGALQSALPNYSFENWNTQTRSDVTGWTTSNEVFAQFGLDSVNCKQTTDAQNGTYAVRVHTVDIFGTFLPGGMVSGVGQIDAAQDPSHIPTIAVGQRYGSLSGYLKFTKKGTDEAEVSIYMFKGGVMVGQGHYFQASTVNTYTQFEAKIDYGSFVGTPDSATIVMMTAKDLQNASGACVLFIDNIQLNTFPLGVKNTKIRAPLIYPNPFSEAIHVKISAGQAIASVFSTDGKEMLRTILNPGDNTLECKDLARGIYILKIVEGEHVTTQKLVKE
jgi:hypothetical protein